MRLPRVRFTIRRMMIAVAVVGLCFALAERLIHGFEDTAYADGYSEQKFLNLVIGMTTHEVRSLMGAPIRLSSWADGGDVELWEYSVSPSGGNCWRRWVFFRNGRVYEIDCRFWVD
jgi:hypothetical protein